MFGLGMPELIMIFLVVMLVFGAKRLPEMGSGLGRGIKNFKEQLSSSPAKEDEKKLAGDKENA